MNAFNYGDQVENINSLWSQVVAVEPTDHQLIMFIIIGIYCDVCVCAMERRARVGPLHCTDFDRFVKCNIFITFEWAWIEFHFSLHVPCTLSDTCSVLSPRQSAEIGFDRIHKSAIWLPPHTLYLRCREHISFSPGKAGAGTGTRMYGI